MSLLGTWSRGGKRGSARQGCYSLTSLSQNKHPHPKKGSSGEGGLGAGSRVGSCQGHRCADPGPSILPRVLVGLSREPESLWVPTLPAPGLGISTARLWRPEALETRRRPGFPAGGRQKAGPQSWKPSLRPLGPTVKSATDRQPSLLSRVGVDGHYLQMR